MSAFFCYFNKKKKQTNKTKQNKKHWKKENKKKKTSQGPETRTSIPLIVNARAVPLRHQANPEVKRDKISLLMWLTTVFRRER